MVPGFGDDANNMLPPNPLKGALKYRTKNKEPMNFEVKYSMFNAQYSSVYQIINN